MTSEAVRPSTVGRTIAGRYTLTERLRGPDDDPGHEGVTLWLAQDDVLERPVALHLVEPGGEAARDILQAAKRGGRVSHPGLANVLSAGDAGSYAFVVSEWVEGTPLSHMILRLGTVPDEQAADLLEELTRAVAAAHEADVVHGRITPDRVLLTDSGARITGIGFAPADTATDADVQALGGLLYCMITGSWPLDSRTSMPRVHLRRGRIPEPRHVERQAPADLAQLSMRVLRPEGRPGGPVGSAAALDAVLGTRPWTTTQAPPPRHFWAWRITLLAVIVTAALVGWVMGTVIGSVPENEPVVPRAIVPDVEGPVTDPRDPVGPRNEPPPPVPVPVPILDLESFDPFGDQQEKDALVPLAADGKVQTAWQTEGYFSRPDFAGLKPGVGLRFDLGKKVDVRAIEADLPAAGLSFQIRAGDKPDAPLDAYPVVAQATSVGKHWEKELPASVRARHWVFWLTDLVPEGAGSTTYRGGLSEVTFYE